MDNRNKAKIKKVIFVLLGVMLAVILSAPYILYREQIQQMAPLGYLGVAIACAISNISILLPSSSTLIVVAAASSLNPILCILVGGLGTALGEQSSYICGRIGRRGFDDGGNKGKSILKWMQKHDFLTVFIFAFLPLPVFDVVGIAAGALRMNWIKFLLSAFLGKTLKFCLAVICVYYFLPSLLPYIEGPGHGVIERILEQFNIH